jgi:Holliday junction resolvase-like predicted endonuclease
MLRAQRATEVPASFKFSSWHVSVAAEAIAAALFARHGLDVSVQYGANQPEYDLIVARGDELLKVSVKGSQDGGWGLSQSYLTPKKADYHDAADKWRARHKKRTVLCFVQFKDVLPDQMPRVYLATPEEVIQRLKSSGNGRGGTILYERFTHGPRARAAGQLEEIPLAWCFSYDRVQQMFVEA